MRNPYEDENAREKLRNAAMLGLGTTGTLASLQSGTTAYRDMIENRAVPKNRNWDKFRKKLEPGDVVFHRRPRKYSGFADLGPLELPLTESDVMRATKGDPFYHSSVYAGRGKTYEASDWERGTRKSQLKTEFPEELKVYRPKNQTPKEADRALKFLDEMVGTPYKKEGSVIRHGLQHLAGIPMPTVGKKCGIGPEGIVCTELTAESYPKIFKDRFASPTEMRHNPGMELVARYGNIPKEKLRETLLTRVAYPILKNAKWGLLAGLGAYGLQSMNEG